MGCLFLGIYGLIVRGRFFPTDASIPSSAWLGASGLVGFVIGDLLLFQAFISIGARLSMLVYATAPIFTALVGLVVFGRRAEPPGFGWHGSHPFGDRDRGAIQKGGGRGWPRAFGPRVACAAPFWRWVGL
ncbi:MAG: EamA family transporter [Spirochaetia bacterium]